MDAAEMVSCVYSMTEAKTAYAVRSFKIKHNYRTCPICVSVYIFFSILTILNMMQRVISNCGKTNDPHCYQLQTAVNEWG